MSKRKSNKPNPFAVVDAAKRRGIDEVAVAFSGGCDSVAALGLALRTFSVAKLYFMYFVRGLSFQESYLQMIERRFGVEIHRCPHWGLSHMFRESRLRHETKGASEQPIVTARHHDDYVRRTLGVDWIVTGEKATDSLERGTQIRKCGGINEQRGRIFAVGYWSDADVASYMSQRKIPLSTEYRFSTGKTGHRVRTGGASFDIENPSHLAHVKREFPADFARILKVFPLAEGRAKQFEMGEASDGKGV